VNEVLNRVLMSIKSNLVVNINCAFLCDFKTGFCILWACRLFCCGEDMGSGSLWHRYRV